MVKLSVVVITYNEAANLARCLDRVQGLADEVLVVDSLSTDNTVAIAEAAGARVIHQQFLGYFEQKKLAVASAHHDYILALDADEVLSDDLQASIREVLTDWTHDGYYVNRLNNLAGHWIHHGGWYPDRKMRLFDRRRYVMRGEDIHERFEPAPGATTTRLSGDLLHYTNDSLESRVATINKFSTNAAEVLHRNGKRGGWLRILVKPPARFIGEYLIKGGFRDGFYGYFIAKTSGQYVWLRETKLWHLTRAGNSRV